MKKCFVIGLIMALVPGMCPAVNTRISDLTTEKLEKMKRLEKCQGTTKGLKIAGLSTLGVTAVGVAGNIAEAVVLNDYKDKVKKEKTELSKQQDLNDQLWKQRSAQLVANQPQPVNASNVEAQTKKYDSIAECYEACKKPARCEIRSESQPDLSVKTWYECATESKAIAGIQVVRDFENQSFAPSDAVSNINTWEITHEEMSGCDEPNFADNSILCHAKKDNASYKFLFKELQTNETGFTSEKACKAQCKTSIGCSQLTSNKRWKCVDDLPENKIEIADYKPFTDGVKCAEYCAETCEYVAATKDSPVLYRCHKSKEQAAKEQKQRAELDEKAAAMYAPRLNKLREDYIKETDACINHVSLTCPNLTMTQLANNYRAEFNKIVAETDKVKDKVTAFDKDFETSRMEEVISEQEKKHQNMLQAKAAVKKANDDAVRKNNFFDSVSRMTKNCQDAKNWLENTVFPNNAKCTYAGHNAFNCVIVSGDYAGNQAFIFGNITGSCSNVVANMVNTPVVNTKLSNSFNAPNMGINTPSLRDEKPDEMDVLMDDILRQQEKEKIQEELGLNAKQQVKFKQYQNDAPKQDVGGTWNGDTYVRIDGTGKMETVITKTELDAQQKALADAQLQKKQENKISSGGFHNALGKQYEK